MPIESYCFFIHHKTKSIMKKLTRLFTAVFVSGILFLAPPAIAQTADAATTTQTADNNNDDDTGKWGLAGLLGLLGLLGLKRRDDDNRRRTTTNR
jgi:hypothetical protein